MKKEKLTKEFEKEKKFLEQMVAKGEIKEDFYNERLEFHEQELKEIGSIPSESSDESEEPQN